MIACDAMSDRMVPVAHGQAQWTADERAHFASCASCRAEWRLIEATRQLGSESGRLEASVVSQAVLGQLARHRRMRRWKQAGWLTGLAAAAAVALLVFGDVGPMAGVPGSGLAATTSEFRLPLAELDSLDSGQLTSVLEQMDAPLGEAATPEAPGLSDLQDTELERVLRSLEG